MPASVRWLNVVLVGGVVLALALLVQTVVNYRYVTDNLIRQSARRAADDRVRDVERAVRLARPQQVADVQALLEEIRNDHVEQIADVALVRSDGLIARSPAAPPGGAPPAAAVEARAGVLTEEERDGRPVFAGTFNCRCNLPRPPDPGAAPARDTGRVQIRIALYEDSLSAPFARVRRNAIISASAAIALIVAIALIAARARAYLRGRQLEAEVRLARQVQFEILPAFESLPPIDIGVDCLPASQVGGDFYDVEALSDGRVSFVVGDVSGHGMAAALLMALTHGAMSNPPWGTTEPAEHSAVRLNGLLLEKSSGARFASMFWCAFDPRTRTLTYLNAGHPPGVLVQAASGRVVRLPATGPVLGLLADATFTTDAVPIESGDLLVVVSDGILEAPDRRGDLFGDERLLTTIAQARQQPAPAIKDAILRAVSTFAGRESLPDDRTVLVVRLRP